MGGLDVETRPAISWATSLPKEWARGKERMVLLILAADHSAGTPAPGRQALADWSGLTLNQVDEAIRALASEVPGVRPALIERLDDAGQPRAAGSGRHNTRYRLRTEVAPGPRPKPASQVLAQATGEPVQSSLLGLRAGQGGRAASPEGDSPSAPMEARRSPFSAGGASPIRDDLTAPVDSHVDEPVNGNRIPPRIRGGLGSQPPRQPPQNLGASSSPTTKNSSLVTTDRAHPPAHTRAREPRLAELSAAQLSLAQAMVVGVVVGIRPDWSPKAVAHAVKTLPPTVRSRHTVEDLVAASRHWAANRHQKYPTQLGWKGHWPVVGEEEAQPPEPSTDGQPRSGVRSA